MKCFVGAVVFVSACGGGGSMPGYETLLDDDFSTYPANYSWESGGGPIADPSFGYPAPSAFLRSQVVSPGTRFMFASQGLDERVTAYLQGNSQYGEQYATLGLDVDFEQIFPNSRVATASYRLIDNSAVNVPVNGFPAGQTAEILCGFGNEPLTHVQVPYEEGMVAYDLYLTLDDDGWHCGYDETEVITEAAPLLTGTYRAELGASPTASAWFDNLLVRRAK